MLQVNVNNVHTYFFNTVSYFDYFVVYLNEKASTSLLDKNWNTVIVTNSSVINISCDVDIDNSFYVEYWSSGVIIGVSNIILVPADMAIKQITGSILRDCINTLSEIVTFEITIPGNTLNDGDQIIATCLNRMVNYSGVSNSLTRKAKIGTTVISNGNNLWSSLNQNNHFFWDYTFLRIGLDLWLTVTRHGGNASPYYISANHTILESQPGLDGFKNNFGLIVAGFDFSQPFTFYVSHQWSVANILSYVKPLASWIYLYPKS